MDCEPDAPQAHAITSLLPPLENQKTVLVVDLVESVRLMSLNETAVVSQWHSFVQHAQTQLLPAHGGRLVKSLGDGLLVEFEDCTHGVRAALAMHRYFDPFNATQTPDGQMFIRAGLHVTDLYRAEHDVYGHGVNLAARITGLAEPGGTVVSASVRDGIVDGVDCDVEDMGESYLKHWPEPVRTWRVHPVSTPQFTWRPERREAPATDFRPSIAIVPFDARSPSPEHFVIGELIADGVITQLSRSQHIRVISRMSTTAFRGRGATADAINARLDAPFVLSGGYATLGNKVMITAELADTRRGEIVWAERLSGDTEDLMQAESELVNQLSRACAHAMLNAEVQRTLIQPLPKLDSNALMLGGITLMHRSTPRDLQRSQQLLEAVAERHKRVAAPLAWLAKWHIMQVVQGLSQDPANDFRRAVSIADRALDMEPTSSLALSIKGHALCHLGNDIDASQRLLFEATQSNPNDPMAWLYAGFWSTMWGAPSEAVAESERALNLSPLDPHQFYLQMLAANSYLVNDQLKQTILMCQNSLRTNRYHLSTLRTLMTAQYEIGDQLAAKNTLATLTTLQPDLTVSKFLAYGSTSKLRQRGAKAMADLGLPKQ